VAPIIYNISTILMSVICPSAYFIAKESGGVEVRHLAVIQVVLSLIHSYTFVKMFYCTD
jgi:hypothetical protein